MSNLGKGATGTVLQGAGTGSSPKYSTATYPATAGTTGTYLVSDGTNIINRNIGNLQFSSKISITNAQLKSMFTTPIEIVPTPGAGFLIAPVFVWAQYIYGGTNALTGGGNVSLYYGNARNNTAQALFTSSSMTGTASRFTSAPGTVGGSQTVTPENLNLTISNLIADFAGNAANDNTMTVQVWYFIFPV